MMSPWRMNGEKRHGGLIVICTVREAQSWIFTETGIGKFFQSRHNCYLRKVTSTDGTFDIGK
jgi:hypothetical protein